MTLMSDGATLVALVVVPAVVGVALLVSGRRADKAAAPLAVGTAVVTVALAAVTAAQRPRAGAPFLSFVEGGELALAVDGLSAVLVVTVAVVAAAVLVFAAADVRRSDARGRFFGYLLLFTAAMLATVTATTFPTLLLGWEVMGAMSYALIGFAWGAPGKTGAATTAFLTTRLGDLGLYVAAGAGLAGAGSLRLTDVVDAQGGWRDLAAAGLLLAALGKSAQLPFSAWLSAAMQGPSAVSALLHSATMVAAGGYLLLRVQPLLEATGWGATAAAWAGALTALVLGAVAAAQVDLKQLLAASTGAQIGFVVLAAGVGSVAGGTAQWVAHAAVKAGLFVVAGVWLTALGTKTLSELRGAARFHRGVGAAATIAALALAGVPPLSLWITKDWAIAGAGSGALRLVALTGAALSAVYAGRMLAVVLAPVPDAVPAPRAARVPGAAAAVAVTLALLAAGLGVLGLPAVARRFAAVVGVEQEGPEVVELAVSGMVAVVVLAVVVLRPQLLAPLRRSPLRRWAGLPLLLTPRPWLALARAASVVDARVVDRGVRTVATSALRLSQGVRRADEAVIDRAVDAVVAGTTRTARRAHVADGAVLDAGVHGLARQVRRLGGVMRRPQTGLLHQYYAQALGGLGVLLLLLLLVR